MLLKSFKADYHFTCPVIITLSYQTIILLSEIDEDKACINSTKSLKASGSSVSDSKFKSQPSNP